LIWIDSALKKPEEFMKLSRPAIIGIVIGVLLLTAVAVFAFFFVTKSGPFGSASGTPTRQPGFGGTPGSFNGTPGAFGGGRLRGTGTAGAPSTAGAASITATPSDTPTPPVTPTFTLTPTFTATATTEKPFSLYYLSSPVKIDKGGTYASAQVLTAPGKNCVLIFTNVDGKVLNVAGTGATQADTVGICYWSWQIPGGTPPGTATVNVTVDQYSLSFPLVVK
jgi:hypothetical protein